METPLKIGFLFLPPNSFLRKTWLKKFCALYNASNHGIQRLEIFDSEESYIRQHQAKIIPLTDCWKVTSLLQKHQPNVFEIRTKANSYQLSAETFKEMSDWLECLQTVAFGKSQAVSSAILKNSEEKNEENLIYSSMDEPEIFPVKSVLTEAASRNCLEGDYILIVTSVNFSIAEESSGAIGKVVLTWPYRHIRRYGCSTENFSFEAGRKCKSGEGLFTFSTKDALKIFQNVDYCVSALMRDADGPSSPTTTSNPNKCFESKDIQDESTKLTNFNFKSLPPFGKPPRKTKSNLFDSSFPKPNNDDNQYEEIHSGPKSSSENFFPVKENHAKPTDSNLYSVSNISLMHDLNDLSPHLGSLKINKSKGELRSSSFDSDYEICGPNIESFSSSKLVTPPEHEYGKLTFSRKSVPENITNTYGTISAKSNTDSKSSYTCNAQPLQSNPDHFFKNDAMYAQIIKKKDHSSII